MGEQGQCQNILILYTFNILEHFFVIFMANYPIEKCWCVHFLREEGGSEKV